MTPEQLKARFQNASKSFIEANCDRPEGARPTCAGVQELEGVVCNQSKEPRINEEDSGQFRAIITIFVSDKRRRDGDGAEATLLDCAMHARRRLMQLPDWMLVELQIRAKGNGGGTP